MAEGFDVEIDAWYIDNTWMLGHDGPTYIVDWVFMTQPNLWIHCKNVGAFLALRINRDANYFFHDQDLIVLTSRNNVWTYFGKPETKSPHSICVMPEVTYDWTEIERMVRSNEWAGYCTDWPRRLLGCNG